MNIRPRTIQILLPSGDPRGIRVAALTTSIVQLIEIPRLLLPQFQEMPESRQLGVYYLIGDHEETAQLAVYVGQTRVLGKRLNEHDIGRKRREFWNRALVAISLTRSLTQTHALYLEWRSIQQSNAAARYSVENDNAGSKPHMPGGLEADCQDIFDTIRTLVATMGQPIFEPLVVRREAAESSRRTDIEVPVPSSAIFHCSGPGAAATGQYTEEGMVVLQGSRCRQEMVPSLIAMSGGKRRQSLIDAGTLSLEGDAYIFNQDVLFGSPSGASNLILGRSSNGWTEWRNSAGRTLDELKRQKAAPTAFETDGSMSPSLPF